MVGVATTGPIGEARLRIVPANEATWDDLTAIFSADYAARCLCQRFIIPGWIWRDSSQEERTAKLQAQTGCGNPDTRVTSGLGGGPA